MKNILVLLSILSLFMNTSCKKQVEGNCFKIKYINGLCGTEVYQILDNNFYSYGQNNWTNPMQGGTLDNVFTLKNECQNITLDTDGTALVQVIDTFPSNCAICLAVYPGAPPTKKLAVKPCEP